MALSWWLSIRKAGACRIRKEGILHPHPIPCLCSGIYNFPAVPHGSGPGCRTMSPVLPAFFYLGESWGLTWEVLWNRLCVQRNENRLISGESRNKNGRLWGSISWKEDQTCDAFGLIVLICFGLARTLEQVFQALPHFPPLYQQHQDCFLSSLPPPLSI